MIAHMVGHSSLDLLLQAMAKGKELAHAMSSITDLKNKPGTFQSSRRNLSNTSNHCKQRNNTLCNEIPIVDICDY